MYYEEKIIDGVLHFRGHPDGDWKPCKRISLVTLCAGLSHPDGDWNSCSPKQTAARLEELMRGKTN